LEDESVIIEQKQIGSDNFSRYLAPLLVRQQAWDDCKIVRTYHQPRYKTL